MPVPGNQSGKEENLVVLVRGEEQDVQFLGHGFPALNELMGVIFPVYTDGGHPHTGPPGMDDDGSGS